MKNKITNEDIENASVKLKPLFGIKPGIYLTVLYSIFILIVLFLLLITPGLRNTGVKVIAETMPKGAAVYVDDIYMGTTPAVFFTHKGIRNFRIEKDFFEELNFKEDIGGRIFGSLFIPEKFHISNSLKLVDPEGFLKKRFKEISSFSLIEDYYERYQLPPLLSRTVREFVLGSNSENSKLLYDFLYSMRVNLGSPSMVDEYLKAINIAENGLNSNNIKIDLSIIFNYFKKENNSEGLLLSILEAYPEKERNGILDKFSKIEELKNILKTIISDFELLDISTEPVLMGKTITVQDSNFIGISSGSYVSGSDIPDNPEYFLVENNLKSYPHPEDIVEFYIMEKEVTFYDYSLFLNENPNWRIENIDNLISKNMVTKDYLAFPDSSEKGKPISNISWYAAKAYCDWLETKLPVSMSEYKIKLPSEAEWEAAARLDGSSKSKDIFKDAGTDSAVTADFSRIGKSGLYDLSGNLWEWNENWFFPGDTLNGAFGLKSSYFEGVEKAVRGGSWANSSSEIEISTRGSQNPSWCTPFIGFRPVLVKD